MHVAEYSSNLLNFRFTPFQHIQNEPKLSDLIRERIASGSYFYSIEVSANSHNTLKYGDFSKLPLFTSIVWLSELFAGIEPIGRVPAIQCATALRQHVVTLPHFTCYNATTQRLADWLSYDFRNVLALRGDKVKDEQSFKFAYELVEEIRRARGDNVSIGVGGYPEMHPSARTRDEDLDYLKKKVDAGADFIITQYTFSTEKLISFISKCRQIGITVPIIPGIFVPETFQSLQRLSSFTQVVVPPGQFEEYQRFEHNPEEFAKFAMEKALECVEELFESDLNIRGVHFYTLNKFEGVAEIVSKLDLKYNF